MQGYIIIGCYFYNVLESPKAVKYAGSIMMKGVHNPEQTFLLYSCGGFSESSFFFRSDLDHRVCFHKLCCNWHLNEILTIPFLFFLSLFFFCHISYYFGVDTYGGEVHFCREKYSRMHLKMDWSVERT